MDLINQKDNQDDILSKLPDDILLTILDQLDLRDAARTSVLSLRWRQLPAMLSRLIIDVDHFLRQGALKPSIDELLHANVGVVRATKSMLSRMKSNEHKIHLLRMTFYLRDDDCISIGHTVGQAMAQQNIEKTEFTIYTERTGKNCTDDDFTCYGRRFMSFFNSCPDTFGGLTRLYLKNLRFDDLDVPNVLSTCRQLMHLRLHKCNSGVWSKLQFVHSQLKELRLDLIPRSTAFWLCPNARDCKPWQYLPKLLDNTSLHELTLNFKSEKVWAQPEDPKRLASIFHKLSSVELIGVPEGCDLTWTMFILDAAPSLKELYITVWNHVCEMERDEERRTGSCSERNVEGEAPNFEHHSLSTLTIFNFQPEEYFVRYIRRVMKAAVNLDDVYLYRRPACRRCRGRYPRSSRYPSTKKQRCSLRKKIAQGTDSLAMIHFPATLRSDHVVKESNARNSVFL